MEKELYFKGFENVSWKSVFRRFQIEKECHDEWKDNNSFISLLIKLPILAFLYKDKPVFDIKGGKVLFLITYQIRKAYVDNFVTIRNLVDSDLVWTPCRSLCFRFIEGIKLIGYYYPSWFYELNKIEKDVYARLFLLKNLVKIFRLQQEISKLDTHSYKLLVTFYDSYPLESFAVEYFRNNKIKTLSLQHGQFTAWCEDSLINSGVELRTFKSDYLLCWNQFTYDEAIKCGISKEKLIIAGIWSYVNTKRVQCQANNNGVFGVVISHPTWAKENKMLIEAANFISKKYNIGYYLKLHPKYSDDAFNGAVNEQYRGNIKKGISMLDYANQVDFSIVGSSSVFVELVYIGHDIYRYSSGAVDDKYKSVKIGKYFSNLEDLDKVFGEKRYINEVDPLFDYLCTVSDVTSAYKNFFSRFA